MIHKNKRGASMVTWNIVGTANQGKVYVWVGYDEEQGHHFYQSTYSPTKPTTNAGYYNMRELLRLKNIELD